MSDSNPSEKILGNKELLNALKLFATMEENSKKLMLDRYFNNCKIEPCEEVINFIFNSIKTLYDPYIILVKFLKEINEFKQKIKKEKDNNHFDIFEVLKNIINDNLNKDEKKNYDLLNLDDDDDDEKKTIIAKIKEKANEIMQELEEYREIENENALEALRILNEKSKELKLDDFEEKISSLTEKQELISKEAYEKLLEAETIKKEKIDPDLNYLVQKHITVDSINIVYEEFEQKIQESKAIIKQLEQLTQEIKALTQEVDDKLQMGTSKSVTKTAEPGTQGSVQAQESVSQAPARAKPPVSPSMVTHLVIRGGINRKLKRKELNTMSLTELKQLHKISGIKMNNNRTIKALINNYIKNYK